MLSLLPRVVECGESPVQKNDELGMLHYYNNVMKAVFPQFGEYQTEVMALIYLGRLFICYPQCRHISFASIFNLLENTNITKI